MRPFSQGESDGKSTNERTVSGLTWKRFCGCRFCGCHQKVFSRDNFLVFIEQLDFFKKTRKRRRELEFLSLTAPMVPKQSKFSLFTQIERWVDGDILFWLFIFRAPDPKICAHSTCQWTPKSKKVRIFWVKQSTYRDQICWKWTTTIDLSGPNLLEMDNSFPLEIRNGISRVPGFLAGLKS